MDEVAEMNKKYIVRLTPEDRQSLEALVRRGRVAAYKAKRAWILLQADASADGPGWPDEKISEAYGVGLRTIHRVRQTWVEDGLAAVLKRAVQMRRRSRKLDGEQESAPDRTGLQPTAGRSMPLDCSLAGAAVHCLGTLPGRESRDDSANAQKNELKPHLVKMLRWTPFFGQKTALP